MLNLTSVGTSWFVVHEKWSLVEPGVNLFQAIWFFLSLGLENKALIQID